MNQSNFPSGDLTYTFTRDGQRYTVTSQVKSGSFVVETDDTIYFTDKFYRNDEEKFLRFDVDEYTLQVDDIKGVVVHRTARIEAADRTVEALEKARRLAGAPTKAKFRIESFYVGQNELGQNKLVIENIDEPSPVMVEFYWKEAL